MSGNQLCLRRERYLYTQARLLECSNSNYIITKVVTNFQFRKYRNESEPCNLLKQLKFVINKNFTTFEALPGSLNDKNKIPIQHSCSRRINSRRSPPRSSKTTRTSRKCTIPVYSSIKNIRVTPLLISAAPRVTDGLPVGEGNKKGGHISFYASHTRSICR